MERIRRIYHTFIPFLAVFMGILLIIILMDNRAEQISKEPMLIYLQVEDAEQGHEKVSWKENEASADEELKGNDLFNEALNSFRSRNYLQAFETFSVLETRFPNSSVLLNYLGMVDMKLGRPTSAIEYFEKAYRANSLSSEAVVNLASALLHIKRLNEAQEYYLRAIELKPNDPDIHFNQGMCYLENDEWEQAIASFDQSAGLSSGNKKARALIHKGISHLNMNDTLLASEAFNQAILLEPANELARINYSRTFRDSDLQFEELNKLYRLNNNSYYANLYLAEVFESRDELQRAEFHYKKVLNQDPSNLEVVGRLSSLLAEMGRHDEAALVVDGIITLDTLPQAYFYKARIAARQLDIETAINLYELAIERAGTNYPEASVNQAILHKESGNYSKAVEKYRYAIKARPGYSLAHYNLALIYSETDSIEKAIEMYKSAIRYDSSSFKSWYNLGQLYEKKGDTDMEIDAYRSAIGVKPDYTRAWLSLGNAYLGMRMYEEAVDAYSSIVGYYPNYTKAWFNLGLAYNRLDQYGNARSAYERLLELDPEHTSAMMNLAILYARNDEIDLAVALLENAVNVNTADPDIRYNLALQYEKLKMDNKAIYQYLRVIELDPKKTIAYDQLLELYNRKADYTNYEIILLRKNMEFGLEYEFYEAGKRLLDLEEYDHAIMAFEHSRSLGRKEKWNTYYIGKAHMDQNLLSSAMSYFETVATMDPTNRFSRYRLGQCYDMLGNREEAERYYTEVLSLDPEFNIVRKAALEN